MTSPLNQLNQTAVVNVSNSKASPTASLNTGITSTNYNSNFAISALFPLFQLEYADYSKVLRRDYLAKMSRRIKSIRKFIPHEYQGWEVLTTLCYNYYGNTTAVHIVLYYNAVHRLELIPGTIIKFPDLSEIKQYITNQSGSTVNNIGKQVTI